MCGLCGILATSDAPLRMEEVAPMVERLRHRGPDGEGSWSDVDVVLGHTRLAILDLAGGAQPLGNEDGQVQVSFNGEIYNHHELRGELEGQHEFRTRSDTEVLVHLYEEHGPSFVERLEGFWALALWDAPRRRLVLSRDRLGKKPLFVSRSKDRVLFGSEVRALLAVRDVAPEVDAETLDEVLALRYVDGARTGFVGIEKLLPGETRVFENGRSVSSDHWQPPRPHVEPMELDAAVHAFRERLDAAVRARLEADVPLGLLLSGGLDSTALLESISRVAPEPVRTFTVAFSRAKESEAPVAAAAAQHFGSRHREFALSEDELVANVDTVLRHQDEPFGDPSILPTTLVCGLARQEVTVCLGGDGGDELFGGYSRYARVLESLERPAPGELRSGLYERILPKLSPMIGRTAKLARRLQDRLATPEGRFASELVSIDAALRGRLLGERAREGIRHGAVEERLVDQLEGPEELGARMMRHDLLHSMPGLILTKVDRASMARSLEMRAPFLDRELVEWAATVPTALKLAGGETKILVRRALEGRVPGNLVTRGKRGFGTPLGRWFRGELREYADRHLGESRLAADGWLDGATLSALLAAHRAKRRNFGEALWTLLSLEVWYRTWILGTD